MAFVVVLDLIDNENCEKACTIKFSDTAVCHEGAIRTLYRFPMKSLQVNHSKPLATNHISAKVVIEITGKSRWTEIYGP